MTKQATSTERVVVQPGASLGRYRLVERIGVGGMGEVWKAHDANLDRVVAIKMIRSGTIGDAISRERFRREALVLSRLSHPGVATIFDFDAQDGYDFLVMEFVPGGTLESRITTGPLPLDLILQLGATIADALENAHRHGVLHRDLKPGNIVITADGDPKILDFGLAVFLSGEAAAGRLTQPGMIVGSLPYMAPEQLFGDADDARTDIYALGVMLFEMVTGKRPFIRERPEALMFAIMNNAPPALRSLRPDAPPELDGLLSACLQKDPALRPASAALVAEALRRIRAGAPASALPIPANAIRAIVVLPFRNLSNDPAQEYFADGMTEAVIFDLAGIKALRVISRTSAMKYKGTELSLPEVARELNVDAVLEGSALLVGNRVRLNVRLISASADLTLWADRYDRELEDVLGLQSELAATVAREIAIQLSPKEAAQLANRNTVNPKAHIEFLKSRHSLFMGSSPEALQVGVRHARRALELDPTFAPAWSALADCLIFRAIRGIASSAEVVAEATAAATKALELDPSFADAHASMGLILSHTGDLSGGLRALRKAVELNPGLAAAHNLLGRALYSYERHAEALVAMHKSISLDPLSMLMYTGTGDAYYFAREYEKSVFHYRMGIELDSRFDGAHTGLARSLEALGRFDEARAEYEHGRRLSGGIAGPSFGLAHLEAAKGNVPEARRILAELTEARAESVVSAWGIAVLHASLGDVDEAFRWLDIAIEEKASGLILLRAHPRLDSIRSDARYAPLVGRVGLESPAS